MKPLIHCRVAFTKREPEDAVWIWWELLGRENGALTEEAPRWPVELGRVGAFESVLHPVSYLEDRRTGTARLLIASQGASAEDGLPFGFRLELKVDLGVLGGPGVALAEAARACPLDGPRTWALFGAARAAIAGGGSSCAAARRRRTGCFLAEGSLEEWLLRCSGLEAIALDEGGREVARTRGVTEILCRWFPAARRTGTLPVDLVAKITAPQGARPTRDFLVGADDQVLLGWVFHQPAALDGVAWLVVLEQRPRLPAVPPRWAEKLTAREIEVSERVIQGLSNAEIAAELGIKEPSVKQHVRRVFDALGVDSRTQLCVRAYQEACRLYPSATPRA